MFRTVLLHVVYYVNFISASRGLSPDLSSVICHLSFFNEVKAPMVNLIIPDKWQQDAVKLLREGVDVVVHAPTGAGKTYIFELLYESLQRQAGLNLPDSTLVPEQ